MGAEDKNPVRTWWYTKGPGKKGEGYRGNEEFAKSLMDNHVWREQQGVSGNIKPAKPVMRKETPVVKKGKTFNEKFVPNIAEDNYTVGNNAIPLASSIPGEGSISSAKTQIPEPYYRTPQVGSMGSFTGNTSSETPLSYSPQPIKSIQQNTIPYTPNITPRASSASPQTMALPPETPEVTPVAQLNTPNMQTNTPVKDDVKSKGFMGSLLQNMSSKIGGLFKGGFPPVQDVSTQSQPSIGGSYAQQNTPSIGYNSIGNSYNVAGNTTSKPQGTASMDEDWKQQGKLSPIQLGEPTSYFVNQDQSYLDALGRENQQRQSIIESILPNISKDRIPEAVYNPLPVSPAKTSYTPGTPLAEFSSPMGLNLPFGLYDERQKSLLNAEIMQQNKIQQQAQPVEFAAPTANFLDQPRINAMFTAKMDEIARKYPNFKQDVRNTSSPAFREVSAASQSMKMLGQSSQELERRIQAMKDDPALDQNLRKTIGDYRSGVIEPFSDRYNDMIATLYHIPDYNKLVQDQAKDMKMDIRPVTSEEMIQFAAEHPNANTKDFTMLIENKSLVDPKRILQRAEDIIDTNPLNMKWRYPDYFKNGKIINKDGLVQEVASSIKSYLGEEMEAEYKANPRGMSVNVSTGGKPDDQRYVYNYVNTFLRPNWGQITSSLTNFVPKKKTDGTVDEPGTLQEINNSLKGTAALLNSQGKQFGGLSVESLDKPVRLDMFNNIQPPLNSQSKYMPTTIGQYIGYVQLSSNPEKNNIINGLRDMIVNSKGTVQMETPITLTAKRVDGTILNEQGMPITGRDLVRANAKGMDLTGTAKPGGIVTYSIDTKDANNKAVFGVQANTSLMSPSLQKYINNGGQIEIPQDLSNEGGKLSLQSLIEPSTQAYKAGAQYTPVTW